MDGLNNAVAVLRAVLPGDQDISEQLGRVVGVAAGLAEPLPISNGVDLTDSEIQNLIISKTWVFEYIEAVNSEAIICVDTATRNFVKTYTWRFWVAAGNPRAFAATGIYDSVTLAAAAELVAGIKARLPK